MYSELAKAENHRANLFSRFDNPSAILERGRFSTTVAAMEVAAGVLFTLASIFLHVVQSRNAGGLWRDEAVSVQVANLPTSGQLWRYLEFDSYPPLFHLLLRVWSGCFTSSDTSLRVFGLLIGLGVVAGFWSGSRALGCRVPLFALVLLGFNPMMICYGDSVRAYGLGCLLALLTFSAVWKVASADRVDWRRLAVAMVAAVLSVQFLYHNVPLLLASCLGGAAVALWRRRTKVAAAAMSIGLPAAISLLPYLPIVARTRRWSVLLRFPVTAPWLWQKLSRVTGAPDPLGVWVWSVLVMAGFAVAGHRLWTLRTARDPAASPPGRNLYAAVTVALGGLLYAGFLFAVGYVTQPWYYLAFAALAALCLDAIFGQPANGEGWRLFRLVVVTMFAAATFGQSRDFLRVRSTNIDLVAGKLNASAAPGDLVVVKRWEYAISLHRYYHGPARLMTVPPIEDHLVHRYDLFKRCMETADPLGPVFDAIGSTLRAGGRVWFVGAPRPLRPGEVLPDLPPVTAGPGGQWPFGRYAEGWGLQAGEFVNSHAINSVAVAIPAGQPVSGFENPALRCFDGWREHVR